MGHRHRARSFCLPWFSSTVFININPRCQIPLRLEACRLPGKESTLGTGPPAHLQNSSPPLPGCPAPQCVSSRAVKNRWADAAAESLSQPRRGPRGGPRQTSITLPLTAFIGLGAVPLECASVYGRTRCRHGQQQRCNRVARRAVSAGCGLCLTLTLLFFSPGPEGFSPLPEASVWMAAGRLSV